MKLVVIYPISTSLTSNDVSSHLLPPLPRADVPDLVDVKDLSAAEAVVQLQARLDSRPAAASGTGSRRSGQGRNTFRVQTVDTKAEESAEAKVRAALH